MAISKLKPRHASEGRSIAAVLKDRLDYDKNPEKTDGGLLVTGYQCSPDTAWQEFAVSKQIYTATTGRKRAPDQDVISYLIIQSFEPGTITPEDANKLGYKLAMEFTGGEHQFIVATHVDKKHIHNHIEFNSTALDCSHKFNNVKNSFLPLRKANDRICQEFGLNIIEEPQEKGKHYVEWAAEKNGKSWKNLLRKNIDRILPAVKTFDEFLEAMRQEGYEVVQSKMILKFRAQGQERFTRSRTLGADYTLEALQERIGKTQLPRRKKKVNLEKDTRINLLMDIQARLQGRGPGMERWMKIEDEESQMIEARAKRQAIEAEKLTGDNIYKVLMCFDKLYSAMNDVERRRVMEALISEIQIHEDRQPNGQWLKSIRFRLPIIEEDMNLSLDNNEHVETVCLMSRKEK